MLNPTRRRFLYVLGIYPDLTTTFIDREILEAKRLGLDLRLLAISRPRYSRFSPAVNALIDETVYLLPPSPVRLLCAHLYFVLRRGRTYFSCLLYCLTRKHPTIRSRVKTFFHFCEGVLAAFLVRNDGIEHIHAHFGDRACVVAIVLHHLLQAPYSLTAHAYEIYRSPLFLKDKIANAKFATTCTAFNKRYLEEQTGCQVELIYHGLDFARMDTTRPAVPDDPIPTLLSVGRLVEKKGLDFLIEACALLRDNGYRFRCQIVGDGPKRAQLEDLVRSRGLDEQVTLSGALPHADVLQLLRRAYLFALPSMVASDGDRDGIPNALLEGMAFQLPVVSTSVSGIPEVVRHEQTGLLVEPGSAESLYRAVARLLDDPNEACRLGQNGALLVRREFDIRKNVTRLIQLLSS